MPHAILVFGPPWMIDHLRKYLVIGELNKFLERMSLVTVFYSSETKGKWIPTPSVRRTSEFLNNSTEYM